MVACFLLLVSVFSLVGGVIGLFIISWELTLIVLILIPIEYLILKSFAKKESLLRKNTSRRMENIRIGLRIV